MSSSEKQQILSRLPGVDTLLDLAGQKDSFRKLPKSIIKDAARNTIDHIRREILDGVREQIDNAEILDLMRSWALEKISPNLVSLINATGVVLHTNLGRALLCKDALKNIVEISSSYSNLEFNIESGKRGIRYAAVEELICDLTGAQSAVVVNNNAGAVLLALNTIAQGREVVVSRGELVEIGGSFRVPDVMEKSGCHLKEVGTTNRTHPRDYENAITPETGLLLKVHTSNYKIEGFTKAVSLKELAQIGSRHGIPVMEDLGSGTLIDYSRYGLPPEPTVSQAVSTGADLITFSGDKLLGGPQAGVIVGKKQAVDQIKKNPLTRALRIDKMTLAALESTLALYRDEETAVEQIPTLKMLCMPFDAVCKKAQTLLTAIKKEISGLASVETADMNSRPGGGSFPEFNLATRCITLEPKHISVSKLEKRLRFSRPAIIGRIENDRYILDPRTIQDGQETIISTTLARVLKK